jgi:hypothetical protein
MLKSDLYGALSRAYCSEKNRSKVLDTDLIESMADEILLLYTQNLGEEGLFCNKKHEERFNRKQDKGSFGRGGHSVRRGKKDNYGLAGSL